MPRATQELVVLTMEQSHYGNCQEKSGLAWLLLARGYAGTMWPATDRLPTGVPLVLSLDDISYFITVQLYVGEPMYCIMITSTVHELHWYLQ